MKTLKLIRPNEWINRNAGYSIYVNGRYMVELTNNSKQTIEIDADEVNLEAKIQWCGSRTQTINLSEVESKTVEIKANAFFNSFMGFGVALLIITILLSQLYPVFAAAKYSSVAVSVSIILYTVYAITFKRTDWLQISSAR